MNVASIGIAILLLSAAGAVLWARRSASDQPRQARVLLVLLYFWLLAFIQLIAVSIGYALLID